MPTPKKPAKAAVTKSTPQTRKQQKEATHLAQIVTLEKTIKATLKPILHDEDQEVVYKQALTKAFEVFMSGAWWALDSLLMLEEPESVVEKLRELKDYSLIRDMLGDSQLRPGVQPTTEA